MLYKGGKQNIVKRFFDIFFACFLGVLLAPLLLVILLLMLAEALVKQEARGPLFFFQKRYSAGRPFTLVKFSIFKKGVLDRLPRLSSVKELESHSENLTWAGKWLKLYSLDELPQLWNILKGEMSFVGPRPAIEKDLKRELRQGIARKNRVTAGLTGPAQVMKGLVRTYQEEVSADEVYVQIIERNSTKEILSADLYILRETLLTLMRRSGE